MKKRRNKCYLAAGVLMTAGLVWLLPMKVEAGPCYDWRSTGAEYYCATPICYKSIPSYFHERTWQRECIGENGTYYEYKSEKTDLGCCPHL